MSTSRPIPEGLLKDINRLEPLPVTAQALLRAVSGSGTGPEMSFVKIAELIELDQAIAANVLKISRSAAYAGAQQVSSIREALLRLGTSALLDLVIGDFIKRLKFAAPMYRLNEDDLWLHSAAAHVSVRAMQIERPKANIPPAALTAALVHDIGKLVMVRHLKADVGVILQHCRDHKVTFVEAERALFGTDHAAVGAAVARKWSFPDVITDAIARHHDPELHESNAVIDAVVTANLVSKTIGLGLGAEGLNLRVDMGCPKRLGLDFESFSRVCVQTTMWMDEIRDAHGLGAAKPTQVH
jgi:putative nucleotidyltransferase with HDIG domain